MSRLEELIAELCPDGVEYKILGEFGTMIRGNGLQKKDFAETGVGCIHYGQIYTYYGAFAYETKTFVSPDLAKQLKKVNTGDLVIAITSENVEDVCKCVAWLGEDEIVIGGHSAVFKHNQNPKYLSYYFQTADFFAQKIKIANGTKVIEVSPQKLDKVLIPLPPLPVQHEIVRILDNFTELTAELTTELTAELIARKKQYEYYRNDLLMFDSSVPMIALGEICIVQSGGTPSKTKHEYWARGTIKWLGSTVCQNQKTVNEVTNYISELGLKSSSAKLMKNETTLIALVGATIGKVAFLPFEAAINQNIAGVYPFDTTKLNPSYVFYACGLLYADFIGLSQGKLAMANLSFVRGLKIPVPPLEEQQRIVDILDHFDALCNDLTSGLPAEIEARRKQYEYYRDRLLTFKEKLA